MWYKSLLIGMLGIVIAVSSIGGFVTAVGGVQADARDEGAAVDVGEVGVLQTPGTVVPVDSGVSPMIVKGRWCGPSNTPKDFRALEIYLNVMFGARNSNQVWQADSDSEVWKVYCFASGGRASITYSGTKLIELTPSYVRLGDGTRVDVRTYSASGGWTVDIKRPGVTKLYKVHVRRLYVVENGV
ncbi:MAG: hypothetical protein DI613_19965 [Kocuria rhizophila]|nr:hypothetical protein [Micrococcaceae bacterium]PZP20505.1 MAG: hypothetical protein DI613_19965 [Kocuria rhizophila]